MRYPIDLHIHTSVNPHAYSTLEENIRSATEKNMKVIAITNHGPALQDSPHWWSLVNMRVIPEYVGDLRVLKGVETNIIDENGNFDINQRIYDIMDIILCGLHTIEAYGEPGYSLKNTEAVINMIRSQKVDIMVHLGNPQFPLEYELVVMEAVKAVFRSWDNPRANVYRRDNDIPYSWGTAVNVQSMAFGNMGDDCGTGVAFL